MLQSPVSFTSAFTTVVASNETDVVICINNMSVWVDGDNYNVMNSNCVLIPGPVRPRVIGAGAGAGASATTYAATTALTPATAAASAANQALGAQQAAAQAVVAATIPTAFNVQNFNLPRKRVTKTI